MAEISLEQRVARLEAREAIKELRAQYGWYAARGDHKGIAGLFTVDGVFELRVPNGERQRFAGRETIAAMLSHAITPIFVIPLIHNDIVRVDGDAAWGTCAMETRVGAGQAPGFVGYYHDRARRDGGGWLFSERRWFMYHPGDFEDSGLDYDGSPRA